MFQMEQVNQTGLTITLINTDKKCQNFKNTCERLESLYNLYMLMILCEVKHCFAVIRSLNL